MNIYEIVNSLEEYYDYNEPSFDQMCSFCEEEGITIDDKIEEIIECILDNGKLVWGLVDCRNYVPA